MYVMNFLAPKMVESSHKIENSSNLSNHINFNVKINETSEISSKFYLLISTVYFYFSLNTMTN